MKKVLLHVIGLSPGQTQGSYTLILGKEGTNRKLAIVIGSFEAQAIAIEIEKIIPVRPMTHDLFVSMAHSFEIEISEIFIHDLIEGIFYAKIICVREGQEVEIDTRTSDAISIAVRVQCPIYTTEEIMEEAGHEFNFPSEMDDVEAEEANKENPETENENPETLQNEASSIPAIGLSAASEEELQAMLDEAEMTEDYERAAIIRDELNKRRPS